MNKIIACLLPSSTGLQIITVLSQYSLPTPHHLVLVHVCLELKLTIVLAGVTSDRFMSMWLCPKCKCSYTENRGLCGNRIREGRKFVRCNGDLTSAKQMPYRPISTWIQDLIHRYGEEQLKSM